MTALGDHLDTYLATRRALGYRLVAPGRLLGDFVAHLDAHGETTIRIDTALSWATARPGRSDTETAARLSVVRAFARWLASLDDRVEVPPKRLVPGGYQRIQPYLYQREEILALMRAASALTPALLGAGLEAAIGLLAATGMRPGEAWRLDRSDVDVFSQLVTVRDSKLGKTRQLPLHDSVAEALACYAARRNRLCPKASTPAFFLSGTGRRFEGSRPSGLFRRLCVEVGVAAPPTRRPPRLYDLRHSFAVQTLIEWHANDLDVGARLPILSAYLGHLGPNETYWYLQAAPELMAVVAARVERFQEATR